LVKDVNLMLSGIGWVSFVNPDEIYYHRMWRNPVHIAYETFGEVRREYQDCAVAVAEAAECEGHSRLHFACAYGEFFFAVLLAVVADGAVEEFHAVVHQDFWGGGDAVAVAVGAHHILYAAIAVGHLPTASLDVLCGALCILFHEIFVGGDEVFVEDGILLGALVVAFYLVAAGGEEQGGGCYIYNRCAHGCFLLWFLWIGIGAFGVSDETTPGLWLQWTGDFGQQTYKALHDFLQGLVTLAAGGVVVASAVEVTLGDGIDFEIAFAPERTAYQAVPLHEERRKFYVLYAQRQVDKAFGVAYAVVELVGLRLGERDVRGVVLREYHHLFGEYVAHKPHSSL